jgi:hypothetical protein
MTSEKKNLSIKDIHKKNIRKLRRYTKDLIKYYKEAVSLQTDFILYGEHNKSSEKGTFLVNEATVNKSIDFIFYVMYLNIEGIRNNVENFFKDQKLQDNCVKYLKNNILIGKRSEGSINDKINDFILFVKEKLAKLSNLTRAYIDDMDEKKFDKKSIAESVNRYSDDTLISLKLKALDCEMIEYFLSSYSIPVPPTAPLPNDLLVVTAGGVVVATIPPLA